jgi:hypothetical protein
LCVVVVWGGGGLLLNFLPKYTTSSCFFEYIFLKAFRIFSDRQFSVLRTFYENV